MKITPEIRLTGILKNVEGEVDRQTQLLPKLRTQELNKNCGHE